MLLAVPVRQHGHLRQDAQRLLDRTVYPDGQQKRDEKADHHRQRRDLHQPQVCLAAERFKLAHRGHVKVAQAVVLGLKRRDDVPVAPQRADAGEALLPCAQFAEFERLAGVLQQTVLVAVDQCLHVLIENKQTRRIVCVAVLAAADVIAQLLHIKVHRHQPDLAAAAVADGIQHRQEIRIPVLLDAGNENIALGHVRSEHRKHIFFVEVFKRRRPEVRDDHAGVCKIDINGINVGICVDAHREHIREAVAPRDGVRRVRGQHGEVPDVLVRGQAVGEVFRGFEDGVHAGVPLGQRRLVALDDLLVYLLLLLPAVPQLNERDGQDKTQKQQQEVLQKDAVEAVVLEIGPDAPDRGRAHLLPLHFASPCFLRSYSRGVQPTRFLNSFWKYLSSL